MMPELTEIKASGWKAWQWLKQEEGEEKVGSIVSSKVELIQAPWCNIYDDFFSIGFTRFAHVKVLNISNNNFTILPECIKECQFLWMLDVSDCKHLREIRGIPPDLIHFYALNCKSLTSSSTSMFLNQELHEAKNTLFYLPGARISDWFDHQSRGPSSSFWFRNKFPDKNLCLVIAPMDNDSEYFMPVVFINGNKCSRDSFSCRMGMDNTCLFDRRMKKFTNSPYKVLPLENEWNHVEVTFSGCKETPIHTEIGIHIFKQESCMEDVRFTDPYSKRKLDNDLNSLEPQNHQLLKKHRFMDREDS